ncbi:hypothetical protein [Microtetraspora malaysiensis]|uniref:hypothetical protein n=1 Tax=Microtetraspora malaysiensis TaxID=161358 RepID=UPI003D9052F0
MGEPNGVVVSFKDMYDDLRALVSEMQTLTTELRESRNTSADHETRIRKLERVMWLAAGAASVVGGGVGAVIKQAIGG